MHNFRWFIGNHALDIVQPDFFYFRGMVRSKGVERMAETMGLPCIPHITGSGLGVIIDPEFISKHKVVQG